MALSAHDISYLELDDILKADDLSVTDKKEIVKLLEQRDRQTAKDDLSAYVRSVDVPGVPPDEESEADEYYPVRVTPALHHELMIDKLMATEAGQLKRLMLLFPPGSAKSTYASVVFPTWFLGRKPGRELIATSYGSILPKKFGRRCRTLVQSDDYQSIMGANILPDNRAADSWSLTNGSTYMGAGILAGITGNRADGLIIDDPLKGREAADSLVIRDKTWEAYVSDLRTRLKPKTGWIIMILTRWHEDDPAGRILPEDYDGESGWIQARDGEMWYVLAVQAECEKQDDPLGRQIGQYFWPEWFPEGFLEQEKISQGDRNWASLYQQRPKPSEGSYFKREWVKWYDPDDEPERANTYGATDFAVSVDKGDWTVHLTVKVDPFQNIYVTDFYRAQVDTGTSADTFINMLKAHKPVLDWAFAKQQIDKAVGPFLRRMMREANQSRTVIHEMPENMNKAAKASSIRGRMWQGYFFLPRWQPWSMTIMNELMAFTGEDDGVDDIVDALARIGQLLDDMRGPGKKRPPGPVELFTPDHIKQMVKQLADEQKKQ
jgi:predicted phage terminase large subunit-like protein